MVGVIFLLMAGTADWPVLQTAAGFAFMVAGLALWPRGTKREGAPILPSADAEDDDPLVAAAHRNPKLGKALNLVYVAVMVAVLVLVFTHLK